MNFFVSLTSYGAAKDQKSSTIFNISHLFLTAAVKFSIKGNKKSKINKIVWNYLCFWMNNELFCAFIFLY